ncbi:MAG: FadR family transcriptional regulator [Betaproteobacteria bacterium PRO3]|nr:FadR family transcriptional regulator [Betaproteobacteria bacterium PRO3]
MNPSRSTPSRHPPPALPGTPTDGPASPAVQVLAYIRERQLEPGERLPSERLLAERCGVTRAMVRETLAALEAMRVVERRPRSGIYLCAESSVASVDAVVLKADLGLPVEGLEADQLNEFRTILESHAAVLACARRTPEDIARMDACMADCRDRFRLGQSIAQPSADFHLALVAATHNQFLLRAANSCYLATRNLREMVFADPKVCRRSIRDHQRIRDAVASGRASDARKAVEAHLRTAGGYWTAFVASQGAPTNQRSTNADRRRGPPRQRGGMR